MWRRWRRYYLRKPTPAGEHSTRTQNHCSGDCDCDSVSDEELRKRPMTKKEYSPAKTHTGNALAQFMILCGLTVVAYQFIVTRLYAVPIDGDTGMHGVAPSPSPWSDAAELERHRNAGREVVSTTEFSCFMACVGLFGLMQRKKKKMEEENAILEAQRRSVEKQIKFKTKAKTTTAITRDRTSSSSDESVCSLMLSPSMASSPVSGRRRRVDVMKALTEDVRTELLLFVASEDLVACAMVSKHWHDTTGDNAEQLWLQVFVRDFHDRGDRFAGVLPRICWRQYYFLHRLSRTVEIARWLDMTQQRKCVVVEGKVYDVTMFMDAHPGGYHVIGDVLGTDATDLWEQFQHSDEAKEMMKEFIVPDVVQGQQVTDKMQRRTLAIVAHRWRQLTWCLAHAHLFGGLSQAFLDLSFKFVVWRTTRSTSRARISSSTSS